jgi:hypothetical protein
VALASVVAVVIVVALVWTAASQGWINFNVIQGADSNGPRPLEGNYSVAFSWFYMGKDWNLKENVSAATYDMYHGRPRTYDYASFVAKDDPIVENVSEWLDGVAKNESYDSAQFILSFVQNIRYGTDENTTGQINYPRYPVETLVDGVGDCKSHSILYVSLMGSPEINASMVLLVLTPPQLGQVGHMAAGLGLPGYSGTYFLNNGKQFFYCETTAPDWLIGQEPEQVANYSVQVLPT